MGNKVLSVEGLTKSYHLGQIGTGTLSRDLDVWWAKVRGKPNPLLKIGQTDHGNQDGQTLWALKDVSFQVQQGEVLGIIGRNGAGKSTLLKILSRVTAPTSGQVKVKGRIASLLEVGTGFHPELTGRENIYLNGAILGMTRQEVQRKFDEIVSFAEVEKFVDTPVKRYSSGMYVRLAFAVAAHLESEILLVDEVLAVGDVEFQKKCLGKMGEVSQAGRTVLFVSHNMGAVSNLCPRVLLIEQGTIVCDDVSLTTIREYYNREKKNIKGAVADLRNRPRKYGDGSVQIEELITLGKNEVPQEEFLFSEPIKIQISIRSNVHIPNAIVGIAVKSYEGSVLFTSHWNDDGVPKNIVPGINVASCFIDPNLLLPGQYHLDVGTAVLEGSKDKVDHVENASSIIILNVDTEKNTRLDFRPGSLRLDYKWSTILMK